MGKVISLNRLKIGEIVTTISEGNSAKCEVIEHLEGNLYKLRILEGKNKGKFMIFELLGIKDSFDE